MKWRGKANKNSKMNLKSPKSRNIVSNFPSNKIYFYRWIHEHFDIKYFFS